MHKICFSAMSSPRIILARETNSTSLTKTRRVVAEAFVRAGGSRGIRIARAQSTAHWHKLKIETFDVNTVVVVWDYANRDAMIGPHKSTCERDSKLGCLVAVCLFNPTVGTQAESEAAGKPRAVMCDYWRNFSSAIDCAEWNKLLLCEMLVHSSL